MEMPDFEVTNIEQLAELSGSEARYELVRGELRMMSPAGGRHGQVAMQCGRMLANHVETHRLGVVYAAETGFILARNPDTVRAPDVAFVSARRQAHIGDPTGFVPVAPDLAIEVISPSDPFSAVEERAFGWLAAGLDWSGWWTRPTSRSTPTVPRTASPSCEAPRNLPLTM